MKFLAINRKSMDIILLTFMAVRLHTLPSVVGVSKPATRCIIHTISMCIVQCKVQCCVWYIAKRKHRYSMHTLLFIDIWNGGELKVSSRQKNAKGIQSPLVIQYIEFRPNEMHPNSTAWNWARVKQELGHEFSVIWYIFGMWFVISNLVVL